MLGLTEIIIIAGVVVVVLFGGKKIVELGRGLGRFTGEFKKGKMEMEKELKEAEKEIVDEDKSSSPPLR